MKYFVCNFKNKLNKDDVIKYNNRLSEIDVKMVNLVIVPSLPFLGYFDKNGYSLGSQDISSFMEKTYVILKIISVEKREILHQLQAVVIILK